jgi:hypothetical protein
MDFAAIDLNATLPGNMLDLHESDTVVTLDLDVAEKHNTLYSVGATYDINSNAVYDGLSRPGPRLVNLFGVLKADIFPFAKVLKYLLKIGSTAFSKPVEIEFAVNIKEKPKEQHEFAILQIRPVVVDLESTSINLKDHNQDNSFCICTKALGNGIIKNVHDIVYVPEQTFDRSKTIEIAKEIGVINSIMQKENRSYILVGPGRWGSSDPWLGIPVKWSQISNAACIIETNMQDIQVEPSQGTHFFQNMTSLGIAYFTINQNEQNNFLNMKWADSIKSQNSFAHTRHVQFEMPLKILVNGSRKIGIIKKPEF